MAPDQRRHPSSQQVVARRVEMRNQPLGRWVSEGLGNNETVFTISEQGRLNELKEVILFDALLSEQSLKPTPNANFMDETEVFFFPPYSISCVSHASPADIQRLSALQNPILSSQQEGEGNK